MKRTKRRSAAVSIVVMTRLVVVLLLALLPLVAGCATRQPPPVAAPPSSESTGVPEGLPTIQVWYTPSDRPCPAFASYEACVEAMKMKVDCVRRSGTQNMCKR